MRSTPTSALEVLFNILPLHIYVEQSARMTAVRLFKQNLWNNKGDNVGHRLILQKTLNCSAIFEMPIDNILPIWASGKNYKILASTREQWLASDNVYPPSFGMVCYTDGSLCDGLAGLGVFSEQVPLEINIQLGQYVTVFQAEVLGILFCARELLNLNIIQKQIYICSDSQSAIAALQNPLKRSIIVYECHQYLEMLGHCNDVMLLWVPGHSNIIGNEKSDKLARMGSMEQFIGPEPYIGISFCKLKQHMKMWSHQTHLQYWRDRSDCVMMKEFCLELNPAASHYLLNLNKNILRLTVYVLTGHCALNKQLTFKE
jgi:ribonuclease HI